MGYQAFEEFVERPRHAPDVSDGPAVIRWHFLGLDGAPALYEAGCLLVPLGHLGNHDEVGESHQVAAEALHMLVDLVSWC